MKKHISAKVSTKGFKKCCLTTAVDRTVGDMWCMALNRMVISGANAWKMKAMTVKMESVTLICTGR